MGEGRAQRSGAEGSSGLASLCLPLLSLPCQAANEVTRPPRLPWAHRVATCTVPGTGPGDGWAAAGQRRPPPPFSASQTLAGALRSLGSWGSVPLVHVE